MACLGSLNSRSQGAEDRLVEGYARSSVECQGGAGGDVVVDCGRSNNKISSDPGYTLVECEVFAAIPVR